MRGRVCMILIVLTLVSYASAYYFSPFNPYWDPSFDYYKIQGAKIEQIIARVNDEPHSTWTAGYNFDGHYDGLNVKNLLGTMEPDPDDDSDIVNVACHRKPIDADARDDEHVFDARKAWPFCPEIGQIRNQGKCASDWVLAPVSVIADRWCIAKNGTEHFNVSAHEPLSCCKSCGWGCKKGRPKMVYKRFVTKGLVSGGDYNSSRGCQPYEIAPCENYKQCLKGRRSQTPVCKPYCYNENFNRTYRQDIRKGSKVIKTRCPSSAANEMRSRGPLSASIDVYEDFLTYKSGIYQHVLGEKLGRLTVKLIGFNDTHVPKYWIAVNSWGPRWGENGTFKIVRERSQNALYSVRIGDN